MTERQQVETTYADLRESDLVIDKAGQAWPVTEIEESLDGERIEFRLCDSMTKIPLHNMRKPKGGPVTVSRVPSHADEAAKLGADFPKSTVPTSGGGVGTTATTPTTGTTATLGGGDEPSDAELLDAIAKSTNFVSMDEALKNLEPIAEPEPLVEYTAKETKAAEAATDDSPVRLPPFADMTPPEQRSHLYLLHGVLAYDLKSRDELAQMHYDAHRQHAEGKLQSKHIPHVHGEA